MTDVAISKGSLVFTQQELDALTAMITSQDRSGFYLTYYAMTNNVAALIQSEVATFSGNLGGLAFVSNFILQSEFGVDGTEKPKGIYTGIYTLSQLVAASALDAIKANIKNGGTGLLSIGDFLGSADAAWASKGIENLFPFNFIAGTLGGNPSSLLQINGPGAVATFDALPYASSLGKRVSDFSGRDQILTLAPNIQVAVDSTGRIEGVFDTTAVGTLANSAISVAASTATTTGGLQVDPSMLALLFGGSLPSSAGQAAVRAGLEQTNRGYNGDLNPVVPDPPPGPPAYNVSSVGTSKNDLIITSGSVDSGTGNDVVIGTGDAGAHQVLTAGAGTGNDIIWGGSGSDTLIANSGSDVLRGGRGDDTFVGGAGNDILDGGDTNQTQSADGTDTLDYSNLKSGITVDLTKQDPKQLNQDLLQVSKDAFGTTDTLHSIEKIKLSDQAANTVRIGDAGLAALKFLQQVDAGVQSNDQQDVLDLTALGKSINFNNNKIVGYDTVFKNFEDLKLGNGNNTITLKGADAASWKQVDFGNGHNTLDSSVINLKVNLGSGTYKIENLGAGSVVNNGNGGNVIVNVVNDILVTAANAINTVIAAAGKILHGAIGYLNSESPWVTSFLTGVKYGFNYLGDLVIRDRNGAETFIANDKTGPGVPLASDTAGIFVGLGGIEGYRLLSPRPNVGNVVDMFKLGNEISFTQTGHTLFNASSDPLVFDLSGNGIRLNAESVASPVFDMNNTGFGVRTGWVQPGTGLLVLDKNGNGTIDNGSELLGAPAPIGFAALAQMDSNQDGVIDANDSIYGQLQIWNDTNGDAKVDPGELETLAQAGIASINVAATTQTGVSIADNIVNAAGSFTRTDGTTGAVDDVSFTVDPLHSTYLGDTTISAAAAAMPNLKGYGTLTDLQVAMTLDPTLIDTFNTNIGNLNQISVTALRDAAMPIFEAWARAVKLPDSNGVLQTVDPTIGHSPVPILVHTDATGNAVVDDFAYQATDSASGVGYWKLASGNVVKDGLGNFIAEPTLEQVMAQSVSNGDTWTELTPAQIGFMERYLGQPLPLDTNSDPAKLLPAMSSFISGAWEALNTEAVRLAMQAGPLAQYFPGLAYNVSTDNFTATTDQQLAPMYEAIFGAAPQDAAGATAWLTNWKPVIDIVLGDLDRGEGRQVSFAYMFASMVHAYETVGLTLDIRDAANALGVPGDTIVEGGSALTGAGNAGIFYLHGGDQVVTDNHQADNFVMGGQFGHDVINTDQGGDAQQDILRFTDVKSTDVTATRNGKDLILTVNGTDEQVTITNEFTGVRPTFIGGNVNDTMGVGQIAFSDGVVWDKPDISDAASHPDPTHPIITGTDDTDALDPGTGGIHYISGGDSGDIYKFGLGYGYDTIQDNQQDPWNDSADYVRFGAGLTSEDVTFFRYGGSDDLYASLADGATMLISGEFDVAFTALGNFSFNSIESFTFADGTSTLWDGLVQDLMGQAAATPGGALYGSNNDEVIDSGPVAGNHYLDGMAGNDTYVFGHGYGHDTIDITAGGLLAPSNATVQFADDVAPADVTWSKVGQDLVVKLAGSNDSLTVLNQFGAANSSSPVQSFTFADGTTLTLNDVTQGLFAGTSNADTIDAMIENYQGGSVISGGPGNDVLLGDSGDTYVFNQGDGQDAILDLGSNTIQFGASITPDMVHVTALGRTTVFTFDGSTDRITFTDVGNGYNNNTAIGQVVFADGTTWSPDDLNARAQTATTLLVTQNGQPTYIQPNGGAYEIDYNIADGYATTQPFISGLGDPGATLTIRISGIAPADAAIQRVDLANDHDKSGSAGILISATGSTAAGLLLDSWNGSTLPFDQIAFDDGTVWSRAQVEQMIVDAASAAPGNQTVYGFGDGSVITAGTGDRVLVGNGNDTFLYSRGDGFDRIEEAQSGGTLNLTDIASTDVTLTRLPGQRQNDLVITIDGVDGGPQGQVTLAGQFDHSQYAIDKGVDQIVFSDGVTWTAADLEAQILAGEEAQSSGNATINGFDGNDALVAGTGNTELVGGIGSDTYVWASGDGVTRIDDQGGQHSYNPFGAWETNTLRIEGVAPSALTVMRDPTPGSTDLILRAPGQKPIILTDQTAPYSQNGVEQVVFDDGTIWDAAQLLLAADGIATTPNGTTARAFDGTAATSTLYGTGQSDTYFWGAGAGNDSIAETFTPGRQKADVVRLDGLNPGDVTLGIVVSGPPFNQRRDLVILNKATGETLTVVSQFDLASTGSGGNPGGGLGIELIAFADGTQWNAQQILDHSVYVASPGSDTISNIGLDSGNVPILASPGVGTLNGSANGSDTFIWQTGDGNDTIYDGPDANGHVDTLVLHNVRPDDVALARAQFGDNLILTIGSTGEAITIPGQLDGSPSGFLAGAGIEQVVFDDGTVWSRAQVLDQVTAIQLSDGDQEIFGSDVGNTVFAGHGNDTFIGDDRDHTFVYRRGDGNDTLTTGLGSPGRQTILKLADISAADVTLTQVSVPFQVIPTDLKITDNVTGDTIIVSNQFNLDNNSQSTGEGVTEIVFADGTVIDRNSIDAGAPPPPPHISVGDDDVTVNLATGIETFADTGITNSVAGIERVLVSGANDTVIGDSGTDILVASGQNDTLIAGTGIDTLSANGSQDTLFGNAYGSTLIGASNGYGGAVLAAYAIDNVTVDLGAGTATINGSSVSDTLIGITAVAAFGHNDTLIDSNGFGTLISNAGGNTLVAGPGTTVSYAIDNVTVDLAAGTAKVNGSNVGDTLIGEFSNASVSGNGDTLIGGGGFSFLTANGQGDTLVAGTGSGVLVAYGADDVLIGSGNGSSLYGYGSGAVATYALDNVTVDLGAQTAGVNGSSVADGLYGFSEAAVLGTNDTLVAGLGDETLFGGGGANSYVYAAADGNDVIEDAGRSSRAIFSDINSTGVSFAVSPQNASDLLITVDGTGKTVTVEGQFSSSGTGALQDFTFADGVTLSAAQVSALASAGSGVTPTVTMSVDQALLNLANPSGMVTFTFSAAPTAFTLADTSAVGGALSNLVGSGTTYTAIFAAAAGTDVNDAVVSVVAGSWQANGQSGAGGSTPTFTVDTVAPTVAVTLNSTDVNVTNPTALVTFTFSDAPTNFALADTSVTGGSLSGLTGSGTTYTAIFTAASNTDTNSAFVSVNSGSWQNADGNAGSGGSTSSFTVDTVTPTVAVTLNGSAVNVANPTALVTFTFSDAPTSFTLADTSAIGGSLSGLSGSGTTYTATFTAASNIDTNSASVSVNPNSWQNADGNAGSGGSTASFTVDTTGPTVNSISASPSSGDENTGNVVHLTLTMSKNVSVIGTPALTLNDGGTAVYQSGSGSNALVFAYTVANGQNTAALAVTGNNLNGSSIAITDADGNAADLTGADTTFLGLKIGATVSSVTATPSSGDLGPGKVITLAVTTSEAVTITGGTPTLSLNDGGIATYKSGSGTNVLNFTYTVGALGSGQNAAALAVTGFNLNGATVYDSGILADTADLSGVTSFTSGPQIDTTAATVASVTAAPSSGDLGAGNSIAITVNFSENVVVTGSPLMSLNDGGKATYVGGSGSNALTFTYTVAAGQNTADLAVTALSANGGAIKDGAGNNAALTGAVTNPAGTLQIDTKAPVVTEKLVSDTGASKTDLITSNDALSGGGDPNAVVHFTVDGTVIATTATASSTGAWTFTPSGLTDGSHTIVASETDGAGNTGTVSLTFTQDTTVPAATSIAANPANGDLDAGNTVSLTVQFSEAVYATATSYLLLNDGGKATYASGSGSNALTFTYTVAAGQNNANLAVTALSSGLTDIAGNAAVLAGTATNPGGTLQIDTTAPKVTSIATSGSGIVAGKGDLGPGQTVTLTVNFGESVLVNTAGGMPALALSDGGIATYVGGSGSSALTFAFTVGALGSGQDSADLKLAATAVSLNGGTITDLAGNAAVLTAANNYNPAGVLQIDTTAPTVSTVVASPATGDVTTGHVVKITLNTNEAVSVSGTPQLLLNDGRVASYDAAHSTSKALAFNYTVAAGDVTTNLTVSGVELPSTSAITDLAGNNAVLGGAGVSLGVQINTTSTGPAGPQTGNITLSGASDAELFGASSANVSFASGSTGTLTLDASSQFAGTVAGLVLGNYLDFADLAYQGNNAPVYGSTGANTGSLAVTEGATTINVALLGSYLANSFVASSDGHGGTLVTDPPPPPLPVLGSSLHA